MVYKKIIFIFLIFTLLIGVSGCYGYKEINDLPLVLGVAIDKNENGKYAITAEIFKPTLTSEGESKGIMTEILQSEGLTILDAIRNLIFKVGGKSYWAQLRVFIISKDIAREGITPVLDFFDRNDEVRKEFPVLISNEITAYDIFNKGKNVTSGPVSIFIYNVMRDVDYSSRYDFVKFYEFVDDLSSKGKSAVLPMISMKTVVGNISPSVDGLGVFKGEKMVGILSPEEAKTLRLLKNKEKGGISVVHWIENNQPVTVSLEIEKSNTQIIPNYQNNKISMDIKITTTAFIGEIMNCKVDVLGEKGREKLKEECEKLIKNNIENLLFKLQNEYISDIIGFGKKLKNKYPNEFRKCENNWSDTFKNISFNINADVKFKGSAIHWKELEIGE